MKKFTILLLTLILFSMFTLPAVHADVIWTPDDNSFYTDHAEECTIVDGSYTSKNGVSIYKSPLDATAASTLAANTQIHIDIIYTADDGTQWGVHQPGDNKASGWVRLSDMEKIYDSNDFIDDHKSEFTIYANELDDYVIRDQLVVWAYPQADRTVSVFDKDVDISQWHDTQTHVYTDPNERKWYYTPYFYGVEGWVCIDDPESEALPPATDNHDADKQIQPPVNAPQDDDQLVVMPVNTPAANNTNLYLAIGAVAVVVLISAAFIVIFYRKKKTQ